MIIHASEMHLNPETQDIVIEAIYKIKEYVMSHPLKPTVVFTGDLFDRAIQNTDRSGLTKLKKAIKHLSVIADIVMIYGTRSLHDIDGCYDFLSEYATILSLGNREYKNFIYLPEIFPSDIPQGKTKEEFAKELCKDIKGKIVLGHGSVLGQSTINSPVIEYAGTFDYKESWLTDAIGCLFGHFHFPYRFTEVKGGYVGSLAHSYKDTGFVPKFDVYTDDCDLIESVEYGFLGKEIIDVEYKDDKVIIENKIISEKLKIRPNVTLQQKDNKISTRESIRKALQEQFPKNEIDMIRIKQIVSDKVRDADVVNMTHYRDMYKLYDPNATEDDLKVQDWLESEDIKSGAIPKKTNIILKKLYVKGYKPIVSTLDKDLVIDFSKYEKNVWAFIAKGGFGKSALSDLLYPHPECLSKPCSKNALMNEDSKVQQVYDIDGSEIITTITQKNTVTTYALSINGEEKCKKNMREYKDLVNSLFGNLQTVTISCITSQRQIQNRIVDGVNPDPDIFNSDNATMKNLYNLFCGSDKTETQKRCKEKRLEAEVNLSTIKNEKQGIQKLLDESNIDNFDYSDIILSLEKNIAETQPQIDSLKDKISSFEKISESNKSIDSQIDVIRSTKTSELPIKSKIEDCKKDIVDEIDLQKTIDGAENIVKSNAEKNKQYQELFNAYSLEVTRCNEVAALYQQEQMKIDSIENIIKQIDLEGINLKQKIENNNILISSFVPCPKCGYLDSKTTEKINSLKLENSNIETKLNELRTSRVENCEKRTELLNSRTELLQRPIEPQKPNILPEYDISSIKSRIEKSVAARKEITFLEEQLKGVIEQNSVIDTKIAELEAKKETYDFSKYLALKGELEQSERIMTNFKKELSETNAKQVEIETKLNQLKDLYDKIESYDEQIELAETEFNNWSKYEKAWGRNGIPARFVEISAPNIDAMTNEVLSQFYPKFFVETVLTKDDGKGNVKETFDILAYNTETGDIYSVSGLSGEQGNFVKTALFFAFRKEFRRNTGKHFDFSFMDEQDSFVGLSQQQNFFDMVKYIQKQLDSKVFVTSHSAEMPNCVQNHINFEEMV